MQEQKKKNIHIISIGGSIMHDLAINLKKSGNNISGSDDIIYNPSKSKLEKNDILPKELGYYKNNINNKIDLVITGMHTKKNNIELIEAQKKGIPIKSYPEYIRNLSENKHRVVIAGSHGKTTVTSIIMHVLKYNKVEFDYLIGAKVNGFENNIKISDSPIIIIEGDEYLTSPIDKDPKFLKYEHHLLLLNGIEWDHYNVYNSHKKYVKQFNKLVHITPKGGEIIYFEEDEEISKIIEEYKDENTIVKSFSYEKYKVNKNETVIIDDDNKLIKLKIFGKHNMQNLAGAKILCQKLGIKNKHFYKAIKTYELPDRRLEKIFDGKIKIFKDFAHSPSKLKATISAVKIQYPNKLLVIYELHSSSSLDINFLINYKDSILESSFSIIYISENNKSIDFTEKFIKECFNEKKLVLIKKKSNLINTIKSRKFESFNKLIMSSGNFDNVDFNTLIK
jgi:UDP-N-acetylmuramate: L-alanyl-gamma-D-glutamyl-meso-diaminopimelate ligase